MTACVGSGSSVAESGLAYLDSTGTRSGMIGHCASSFHATVICSPQAHAENKTPEGLCLQQE
jgi:hypothetical protein